MEELSKRKQKILRALVDEFVSTAEPVSSGDIKAKYMPEVSSATIRNDLAALEKMGYLEQPHTSSGRVPLPQAYKLYVENIIPDCVLTPSEIKYIRSSFDKKVDKVEDIIKQTAKVLADVTNYTSVIVVKNFKEVLVKEIKLVPIGDDTALVIVITDNGVLKDKTIDIPKNIRTDVIESANRLVNKMFGGKTVEEILEPYDIVDAEMERFRSLFEEIVEIIAGYNEEGTDKVYMEGALKMLDYPEYNNIDDARKFLSVIGEHEQVASLLDSGEGIEFSVKIGKEESGGLDKCAIVTAKYVVNGKEIGQAGVIGPERMNYNKVISVLNYLSKAFDKVIDGKKEE